MNNFLDNSWHVDGHNLTAVVEAMPNGGWKHVCTCDYGYAEPEKHLELNKKNANNIALNKQLICALQWLVDAVPYQDNDHDWWPDELRHAMENANLTLEKIIE